MPLQNKHILVVDDDRRLRELLKRYLEENGFQASTVQSALEAREALSYFNFQLIILDIMMPGETGLEFIKSFRHKSETPVLLLTAMGDHTTKIEGLELGADEYMSKPFDPKELILRIKAILKRVHMAPAEVHLETKIGPFIFSPKHNLLQKGENIIPLTHSELKIFKVLIQNKGQPISREEIVKQSNLPQNIRAIDVQITRLRKKIEEDPKSPRYLQTVRHKGYVLQY